MRFHGRKPGAHRAPYKQRGIQTTATGPFDVGLISVCFRVLFGLESDFNGRRSQQKRGAHNKRPKARFVCLEGTGGIFFCFQNKTLPWGNMNKKLGAGDLAKSAPSS